MIPRSLRVEWCIGLHKLHDVAPKLWSLGLMKLGAKGQLGPEWRPELAEVDSGARSAGT